MEADRDSSGAGGAFGLLWLGESLDLDADSDDPGREGADTECRSGPG